MSHRTFPATIAGDALGAGGEQRGGGVSAGPRALLLLPYPLVSLPMSPLRRPSRRFLGDNMLTGSVPSQLGLLTALTRL